MSAQQVRLSVAVCMGALVLVGGTACSTPGAASPPESDLERLVFFVERDQREHLHELSGKVEGDVEGDDEGRVTHVPWGRPVDVNSRIEIHLDKSGMQAGPERAGAALAAEALRGRKQRLEALLGAIEQVQEQRLLTGAAWRALEQVESAHLGDARLSARANEEFERALGLLAPLKERLFTEILELYPDTIEGQDARNEVEDGVTQMLREGGDVKALSAFLQREIESFDTSLRAQVDAFRSRGTNVRLEAFLVPGEDSKEPAAIHLEGYDDIDAKSVRVIDRFGLRLSADERARLQGLLASAQEIAAAIERVRAGDAKLETALRDATSDLGKKLSAFVTEADAVAHEWESAEVEARWTETVDAIGPLVEALGNSVAEIAASEREGLRTRVHDELARWTEHASFASDLIAVLRLVREVHRAWDEVTPQTFPVALERSAELAQKLGDVLDSAGELRDILAQGEVFVVETLAVWKASLPAASQRIEDTYAASALQSKLTGWRELVRRSTRVLTPVASYLGFTRSQPLNASIRAPGALDVPLDDAPNTAVDLTRTERKVGDRVEVRASIVQNGNVVRTSHASFELEKLGWHADLVPGVVLTTADRLTGSDDSGGFTAQLSWMLRYGARPEDQGLLADSSRWLGWGLGLHATLLNFDPDEDVEIGLGTTVGLWGDRLLFGVGVNPLASSDEDGRFYYFFGSSLIPLLQALD